MSDIKGEYNELLTDKLFCPRIQRRFEILDMTERYFDTSGIIIDKAPRRLFESLFKSGVISIANSDDGDVYGLIKKQFNHTFRCGDSIRGELSVEIDLQTGSLRSGGEISPTLLVFLREKAGVLQS